MKKAVAEKEIVDLSLREFIKAEQNPATHEYSVKLKNIPVTGNKKESVVIEVQYVPDRLILIPDSFTSYLDHKFAKIAELLPEKVSLEEISTDIISDINNQIMPLWIKVTLTSKSFAERIGETEHNVVIEDQQPSWNNQKLLSRIK